MKNSKGKLFFSALLLSSFGYALYRRYNRDFKDIHVVDDFKIKDYLGKWYEIARMDFKFEKNLINTTANYSLDQNGDVKVINSGFNTHKKEWKMAVGKAKLTGLPSEGKLKVAFWGPFYSPYNIISIDEQYKYALVVGKNTDYLWILSRKKTIPSHIKKEYLAIAKSLGFETYKLNWVKHT